MAYVAALFPHKMHQGGAGVHGCCGEAHPAHLGCGHPGLGSVKQRADGHACMGGGARDKYGMCCIDPMPHCHGHAAAAHYTDGSHRKR